MRFCMRMKFLMYILLLFSIAVFAAEQSNQDNLTQDKPWAVLGYYGRLTNNEMLEVMTFDASFTDESLYSLEISRELDANNSLRRFFQPIISSLSAALNLTYRNDPVGPIYEIDPYLLFQWTNFPWNNYVKTSIGIGEGLSYVTKVPQAEAENSTETQNLLNFLMFEIGVAMPSHPEWEILGRVHHRSGVFGLYTTGNSGSTAVGLAIRYHF